MLREMCENIVDHNAPLSDSISTYNKFHSGFLADLIKGSLLLENVDLCNRALKAIPDLDVGSLVAMRKALDVYPIAEFEQRRVDR